MKKELGQITLAISLTLPCTTIFADHTHGGFSLSQKSAIVTESAVPLAPGAWNFSINTEIVENKLFSDDDLVGLRAFDIEEHGSAHADLHSIEQISSTSITVGYGYSENLTLGVNVPYIRRKNIREPDEGHADEGNPIVIDEIIEHGNSGGIGDTMLFGMYRLHNHFSENFTLSLLFGLKVPTGETHEQGFRNVIASRSVVTSVIAGEHEHDEEVGHLHAGTRLEAHQQPGSGSYDPLFGFAYSRSLARFTLDSSVLYTFVNEGSQNTNLGDRLKYNLALTYPFQSSLDLVLELNGNWRDREIRGDEIITNSGGHHVYASPGIRYSSSQGWSLSVSYGIPIREKINGFQSDPDYRWLGSLSFNF